MSARIGSPKTGGRIAGKSLDRGARQLVSSSLAGSILETFEQLGGTADMVKWAKDNRTVFYTQVLSRLMPAPQKDDPDVVNNTQINIGDMSAFEAARNVAFALAKAIDDQQQLNPSVAERVPGQIYDEVPQWRPPDDMPELTEAEAFADKGPLHYEAQPNRPGFTFDENDKRDYEQQYRAWELTKNTLECDITNYRGGSSGEQGGSGRGQPQVITRRTSAREIMNRRRDSLL
ncbi:hypothetical protein [Pseudomonas hormoni]